MSQFSTRLSGNEKIGLLSGLATMLAAGIPILDAVTALLEEAKGNQKKVLETLQADLRAGNFIHTTFAKFGNVFNKVTVNLIKAAEEAGSLEVTLRDVKDNIQKEMEFSDKIRAALMYPLFVFGVFIAVLLTVLIVVMPRVSKVFSRLKVELPLPTKIMIATSDIMAAYGWWILAGFIGLVFLIVLLFRWKREIVMGLFLGLPVVSNLVKQIDFVRFTRSLNLLLSSGLPIATALELAQDVVSRHDIQKTLHKTREMVISGKSLTEGLRTTKGLFPGTLLKLIEVGEQSGTLAKALKDISENLDYEVSKQLKSATALIEPIMLVIIGLSVGGMMMAIIAPIYGLISNVGTR